MIDGTLFEVKQTDSETVLDYMARLNTTLANKTLGPAIRLAITLQGLRSSIRKAVLMKEPGSLDHLRHAALLCEKTLKATTSGSEAVLEAVLSNMNSLETKFDARSSVNTARDTNDSPLNAAFVPSQGGFQQDMQRNTNWEQPQYPYSQTPRNKLVSTFPQPTQRQMRPTNNINPTYGFYQNT